MDVLARTKHWAWGAVIAALCSFAFAKGPGATSGARFVADNFLQGNFVTREVARGHADADLRRVAGRSAYPGEGRGGIPYAGAITPVSTESRGGQRAQSNAPVRSGSIRADVARYNEERGATRAIQRQADDGRPPDNSPYRN